MGQAQARRAPFRGGVPGLPPRVRGHVRSGSAPKQTEVDFIGGFTLYEPRGGAAPFDQARRRCGNGSGPTPTTARPTASTGDVDAEARRPLRAAVCGLRVASLLFTLL